MSPGGHISGPTQAAKQCQTSTHIGGAATLPHSCSIIPDVVVEEFEVEGDEADGSKICWILYSVYLCKLAVYARAVWAIG
jgi:hypothetical protein